MLSTTAEIQETREQRTELPRRGQTGFLVSPWFDLFFVCNLYWPLVLLIDQRGGLLAHESLLFWQVFFITTPHRWITLFLVFGDREKMAVSRRSFFGLAALVFAGVCSVWLTAGSLVCLVALDYLWNAWHFAAQHHGVSRIYARSAPSGSSPTVTSKPSLSWVFCEKWLFRSFILYVIARIAGWSWEYQQLTQWAERLDYPLLLIPILIVCGQVIMTPVKWGRVIYTISTMSLFSLLLCAVHWQNRSLVLQLSIASALFHAVEYLAIVSWSMRNPRTTSRQDLFGNVARSWIFYLGVFMVILGASSWMLEQGAFEFWAAVNLSVAFLHYGYDGMIWKKRGNSPRRQAAV